MEIFQNWSCHTQQAITCLDYLMGVRRRMIYTPAITISAFAARDKVSLSAYSGSINLSNALTTKFNAHKHVEYSISCLSRIQISNTHVVIAGVW